MATGISGEYTGLFVDDLTPNLTGYDYYLTNGSGASADAAVAIDADQDGFSFTETEDGPAEAAAWLKFNEDGTVSMTGGTSTVTLKKKQ